MLKHTLASSQRPAPAGLRALPPEFFLGLTSVPDGAGGGRGAGVTAELWLEDWPCAFSQQREKLGTTREDLHCTYSLEVSGLRVRSPSGNDRSGFTGGTDQPERVPFPVRMACVSQQASHQNLTVFSTLALLLTYLRPD